LLRRRSCVSLLFAEAEAIRNAYGTIRLAGAVLAGLLLSLAPACAAGDSAPGYLVITLGTSNATYPLFLDYASSDHRISEEVQWSPATPNDLGSNRGEQGVVYVKALPPGRYGIYRIALNDGSFIHHWTLSLPFTIAANQVTYAGDFDFVLHQARDILGRPIAGGGYFRLSDESIGDIPVAARKALEPGLIEMPVDSSPMAAARLDAPPFCLPLAGSAAPSDTAPRCPAPKPIK
jgi:hypothetical protein